MAAVDVNKGADFYARLFNVSERRIQQLAKDGIIPKDGRGKYPMIGSIQGYVRFLQDRASGNGYESSDSEIHFERVRLTRAQAVSQEIKNDIALGDLVTTSDSHLQMSRLAKAVASGLDSLADMLERDAGLPPEAIDLVEATTDALREQMYQAIIADDDEPEAADG